MNINWSDKNEVLEAVRSNGFFLQYTYNFRNDKEVVLEAVKQDGSAFQFACNEFKSNPSIVMEAVKLDGEDHSHQFGLALTYQYLKEYSKAIESCLKAIQIVLQNIISPIVILFLIILRILSTTKQFNCCFNWRMNAN